MQRWCFYMNVFILKNRLSSENLRCHFNFIFPVMPDKVAFECITLISAVTVETAISPATTAPPAGRESLLSVCKHKQKASELF